MRGCLSIVRPSWYHSVVLPSLCHRAGTLIRIRDAISTQWAYRRSHGPLRVRHPAGCDPDCGPVGLRHLGHLRASLRRAVARLLILLPTATATTTTAATTESLRRAITGMLLFYYYYYYYTATTITKYVYLTISNMHYYTFTTLRSVQFSCSRRCYIDIAPGRY